MSPLRADSMAAVTPQQRLIITLVVMVCTIMQLLDTTIVNVALPHMKGQLGASPEQISWVLTSYVVAASIFMPLTGFFSDRIGVRNYLLVSIAGFTLTSMLCGLATTLQQIVVFRVLQGVFGAALVPLSQMILIQLYPAEERGRAMSIWGVGIMAGPILGPTLGGWLTENWSWHWTFFINVPIGGLLMLLAWLTLPSSTTRLRRMDWTGFALMAGAVAGLQLILDLGERHDWFQSNLLRALLVISLVSLAGFIWRGLNKRDDPLFDLSLFRDRNFVAAVLLITTMSLGFYGATLLVPLMLVGSLDFSPIMTGLLLAPRGLATIFSSLLAGQLMKYVDGRLVVAAGVLIIAAGSYPMTLYSLDTTPFQVMIPGLIQGLGLGLIFVPLSTMAYRSLASHKVPEATGVFSLIRSMGGSVGIAILSAFTARHAQTAWSQLRAGVQETSPSLQSWQYATGFDSDAGEGWKILAGMVAQQSQMVAYIDAFKLILVIFLLMLPLLLLFRGGRARGPVDGHSPLAE